MATAIVVAGACSRADASDGRVTLDVYAASSLTEAFSELERLFEDRYPAVDATLTFAGSQVLRVQIEQGAPADVFASADPDHVRALEDAGLVIEGRTFTHNELVVIVPLGDPAGIESFGDLARAERIVLGTEAVPAGRYAREAIARYSDNTRSDFEIEVLDRVVSEESNVRLVRAKVELGEADAAIVYRTDAAASDDVEVVWIPSEANVLAVYRIGVVADASGDDPRDGVAARQWVDFVLSSTGREVLARHGFAVE